MHDGKPRLGIGALLVALTLVACGRSFGCIEGEKTYETFDGKVSMVLVRKVEWSGGKIPGPVTDFFVRVGTQPGFEEPVDCDRLDFAEDELGTHVAFRCTGAPSWTVLRLRGGDARLRECDALDGDRPDFTRLTPLHAATDRILRCARDPGAVAKALIRAVRQDEGREAALDVVDRLASGPLNVNDDNVWPYAMDALDEQDRDMALGKLCTTLGAEAEHAAPERYLRAVRICDHASAGPAALAILRTRAALGGEEPDREKRDVASAVLLWAAALGSRESARAAGEAACRGLEILRHREGDEWQEDRVRVLATVLGRTGTRCDALVHWHVRVCGELVECDGALCSSEHLATFSRSWDRPERGAGNVRLEPVIPELPLAVLHAMRAGPLPGWVVRRQARLHYTQADAGLVDCDRELEAGTPCHCELHDWELCQLDAGDSYGASSTCRFRVDDVHRALVDVTPVSAPRERPDAEP